MHKEDGQPLLTAVGQSRRAFCGRATRFTVALALFPLAELFTSCNSPQQKKILRPSVQINNTGVISNTRYIGGAFSYPEQMISASLAPTSDRISPYDPGISFIGIIAQDTSSAGYDLANPYDVVLVGMFKQKNGTFRYGYEVNGVRHFARGHVLAAHYRYNINFQLNEEGLVKDPEHPHQRRFGYDFQISRGFDNTIWIQGLQSSATSANQLFVGVMDEGNDVHLPDNKQLQLHTAVSGNEQVPDVIYTNEDNTSQVSSQFSASENRVILTFTGSY